MRAIHWRFYNCTIGRVQTQMFHILFFFKRSQGIIKWGNILNILHLKDIIVYATENAWIIHWDHYIARPVYERTNEVTLHAVGIICSILSIGKPWNHYLHGKYYRLIIGPTNVDVYYSLIAWSVTFIITSDRKQWPVISDQLLLQKPRASVTRSDFSPHSDALSSSNYTANHHPAQIEMK